jgi:hypothetical protein
MESVLGPMVQTTCMHASLFITGTKRILSAKQSIDAYYEVCMLLISNNRVIDTDPNQGIAYCIVIPSNSFRRHLADEERIHNRNSKS